MFQTFQSRLRTREAFTADETPRIAAAMNQPRWECGSDVELIKKKSPLSTLAQGCGGAGTFDVGLPAALVGDRAAACAGTQDNALLAAHHSRKGASHSGGDDQAELGTRGVWATAAR